MTIQNYILRSDSFRIIPDHSKWAYDGEKLTLFSRDSQNLGYRMFYIFDLKTDI